MSSYRALRILAQRLATLGFDTLRVDYDGTGNSEGCAHDPARVDAWLRTVERAMAEVRRRTASGTIALVGVRAGSILALRAGAAAGGVARIVLWSPFQSGRAFIRELTATARLSAQDDACNQIPKPESMPRVISSRRHRRIPRRWTVGDLPTSPAEEILISIERIARWGRHSSPLSQLLAPPSAAWQRRNGRDADAPAPLAAAD